jgi:hypothetical protein
LSEIDFGGIWNVVDYRLTILRKKWHRRLKIWHALKIKNPRIIEGLRESGRLVDQPEYGTNRLYLIDFIPLRFNFKDFDFDKIKHQFLEKHQTAAQIASEYDVSKSVILGILRRAGAELGTKVGRSTHPENYRNHCPPYGYKIRNGRLVPNKSELKVCRAVVELRGRRGLSTTAVGRELEMRGYKNRAGRTIWNSNTILNIFKRWNGKL